MGTLETVFPLCKQKSCSQLSFCSALATLQARPASRLVVSVTPSGSGWSEVPAVTPAGPTFLPVKLPGTAPRTGTASMEQQAGQRDLLVVRILGPVPLDCPVSTEPVPPVTVHPMRPPPAPALPIQQQQQQQHVTPMLGMSVRIPPTISPRPAAPPT